MSTGEKNCASCTGLIHNFVLVAEFWKYHHFSRNNAKRMKDSSKQIIVHQGCRNSASVNTFVLYIECDFKVWLVKLWTSCQPTRESGRLRRQESCINLRKLKRNLERRKHNFLAWCRVHTKRRNSWRWSSNPSSLWWSSEFGKISHPLDLRSWQIIKNLF